MPEQIATIRKWHDEIVEGPKRFAEKHGHGRPPLVSTLQGSRIVGVGPSLYRQAAGTDTDFPTFVRDHAWMTVGESWMQSELEKPLSDQHQLAKWFRIHTDHAQRHIDMKVEVPPIGAGAAWMRFAYDLYQIRHNAKLEERLLARLLDKRKFQGARFELTVAASFVSAGFGIDFEDETDNKTDHPEFIATDMFSTAKLAVEAKSRHRKGVYDFAEGFEYRASDPVNVRGLMEDALSLNTALPYVICIDPNLPPFSAENDFERWLDELSATVADAENVQHGPANFPANCVLFANDPSHYVLEQYPLDGKAAALWSWFSSAEQPRTPCSVDTLGKRLQRGYFQRSTIPEKFPRFSDSGRASRIE